MTNVWSSCQVPLTALTRGTFSSRQMHVHRGVRHLIDPGGRKQLLTLPLAIAQVEIANFRHVA
jgi:hypothetical protein